MIPRLRVLMMAAALAGAFGLSACDQGGGGGETAPPAQPQQSN
jgi:hypothetical protein